MVLLVLFLCLLSVCSKMGFSFGIACSVFLQKLIFIRQRLTWSSFSWPPGVNPSLPLHALLTGLQPFGLQDAPCRVISYYCCVLYSGFPWCWAACNPVIIKDGVFQHSYNLANLLGWICCLCFLFPVLVMVQAFEFCDNRQKVFHSAPLKVFLVQQLAGRVGEVSPESIAGLCLQRCCSWVR